MPYVISRLCRDCVDQSCVEVCPVDCIVQHRPETGPSELPNQLFIDPEECISCGLCPPECPWEAIYEEDDVPAVFADDVALNAVVVARRNEFAVPETKLADPPSPGQIQENKTRWGVE
jgi:ferredoxin